MRLLDMHTSLRAWLSLALLLALRSPAAGADPEMALRLDTPRPLSEVARLLSERSGVPVRVDANGGAPVGPVDLDPLPLRKVLAIVARWAKVEVRQEGDGYVLAATAGGLAAAPAAPMPTPPGEVIARIKPLVALVIAYFPNERARAQGTGFIAGIDSLVVTNYHVVRGGTPIQVLFEEGTYFAALAAYDEDSDLAVLRVGARFRGALRLGDSDQLREGDDVALTGFPMALELLENGIPLYSSTAKATVNAIRPGRGAVSEEPMPFIQIDAPVNPGYSGGPLYRLDNGQVVGVVQSKIAYDQTQDSGVSFAVPVNRVRRLLAAARANPVAPPSEEEAKQLAASIPLALRLQPVSPPGGGEPASQPFPSITRPFDLLPPVSAAVVPNPPLADIPGLIPLHAPGGKMLVDPARPRLYAADFGGNSVAVIDTEKESVVERIFAGSKPYGLAVGPGGRTLYVANSGGSEIALVDLEKMTAIGRIPLSLRPFDLALGPGGRILVTAAGGARAGLRSIDLRRQMELPVEGSPLAGGAILAVSGTGENGFAVERGDAPAALFALQGATRLAPALVRDAGVLGTNVQDVALSPDGSRLYIASLSLGYVSVLDATNLRPLGQLEVGSAPAAVKLSPDGLTAYVCHGKKHVDRFDTRTFLRTGSLPLPDVPLRVAVSNDGGKLFVQLSGGVLVREAAAIGPPVAEE
ncbi:MAG: trypsin-like peptidase domain-containing protein [Armatimonadetes bacterium]|nr:trypsin-like peptidase domain-containing protein [Armatimonadota bacterium]